MAVRTVIENGVVPTLCRQCDMRCGINCHIRNGRITKITGLTGHVESRGRLCPKAPAAIDLLYHPDRLVTPLKRCDSGSFVPISYPEAMAEIARAMEGIKHIRLTSKFKKYMGVKQLIAPVCTLCVLERLASA
jgi:anaerobic selenocysteine-containing dehydrogenase